MTAAGQQPTKVNVNIDATNERGKQGRDFYFHVFALAMVLARHIPIKKDLIFFTQ